MINEIWCLFSVENNYDQPNNNLVNWWPEKPSIDDLAKDLELNLNSDEDAICVVRIHQGFEVRIENTDYRLELVRQGKIN